MFITVNQSGGAIGKLVTSEGYKSFFVKETGVRMKLLIYDHMKKNLYLNG